MDLQGFDELEKQLEAINQRIPKVFEELKTKVSSDILEDVVQNTPVNKDPHAVTRGNLRRGWKVRDKGDAVEIYNDVKSKDGEVYAWDVEYGHRTRAGMNLKKTKRRRKSSIKVDNKIAFVPGVFMLRNAMIKGKATLEDEGKKALEDIVGGK